MIIYILIYLIGFILTYSMFRKNDRQIYIHSFGNDEKYSWENVKNNLFVSLFSWIVILLFLIWHIYEFFIKIKNNTKPPKWL